MPTSINKLLKSVGLDARKLKTVKWEQAIDCSEMGIYIVSTSEKTSENSDHYESAPLDDSILQFWLNRVQSFQLDGKQNPSISEIRDRLCNFWIPDENILYIGQTEKQWISKRVRQYYKTELGNKGPHAGGNWIKTLKILNKLFVHYLPLANPKEIETELLNKFIEQVSENSKRKLLDRHLTLPFANLELDKGTRKKHGISKSKLIK